MDVLLKPKPEQKADEFEFFHDGTLGRCPHCGRLIMLPCLACATNEREIPDEGGECTFEVELYGAELERYLRIRAYRERFGVSLFDDPLFVNGRTFQPERKTAFGLNDD